ncbi:uncharacterized protein [Bemisia tabaci]|uniref:uncharacterized protein n=1 Tax=Bemisia tabaci TaxID=7038 RepID=UPI003B285B0A
MFLKNSDTSQSYLQALENLTSNNRTLFLNLLMEVHSILHRCKVQNEMEMLISLYGPIQDDPFGSLIVAHAAELQIAGVGTLRRNKFGQNLRRYPFKPSGSETTKLDVVIITKDARGIIMELKFGRTSAFQALQQIIDRAYFKVFEKVYKEYDVWRQIFVGVSFSLKNATTLSYLFDSMDYAAAQNVSLSL